MDCYSMGISTHNWWLKLHACHVIVHLNRDRHIWRYHKRPLPLLAKWIAYSQAHLTCQYWCDANYASCAEQWLKCQSKSPKYVLHKKRASKRFRNSKKGLGGGLNPQLSWLTIVCLHGFVRNVSQKITIFPLRQCFQRAVMNEPKQLSISNQHIRVPRWHAFNFAQVPLRYVLGMRSNSVVKTDF